MIVSFVNVAAMRFVFRFEPFGLSVGFEPLAQEVVHGLAAEARGLCENGLAQLAVDALLVCVKHAPR